MSNATKMMLSGMLAAVVLLGGCSSKAAENEPVPVATTDAETEAEATSQIFTGTISGISGNEIALEQTTNETVTITVNKDTQFTIAANSNDQSDTSDVINLTLADMNPGELITVTINPDSFVAESIEVQAVPVAGEPSPETSSPPLENPEKENAEEPSTSPEGDKSGQPPAEGKGDGAPPSGAPGKAKPAASPGSTAKPAASAKPAPAASDKPSSSASGAGAGAGAGDTNAKGPIGADSNSARTMNFGKIKSISGSSITIYTAEAPSAPPQTGSASGSATDGQGSEPLLKPSGEPGAAGGDGGGMPQGGGGQQSFSEQTTVIIVGTTTKLLSVTFENGKRTESTIAISALKAGDVIQYTLKTGSTEAESISLSSGDPGNGK